MYVHYRANLHHEVLAAKGESVRHTSGISGGPLSVLSRYGKVGGVDEQSDFQSGRAVPKKAAGRVPSVGPLSSEQQPATKADLYAAVDALRADMRELLENVRTLIQAADSRVTDLEQAKGEVGHKLPEDW
ncbi:hypothetical protein [Mycobacterium haemophilum]|uniref:hypothetical protein n=1 Tax=Mycobacterium haemophilum TaxID=29311 RepID=UPI000AC2C0EB|nr:hypothetical protein [Mycobacterium haemophilum]